MDSAGDEPALAVEGFPAGMNVKTSLNPFTFTAGTRVSHCGKPTRSHRFLDRRTLLSRWVGDHASGGSTSATASYSNANNWVDFVEGARFQANITSRLGVFFIGDAGGGGLT